MASIVMWSFGDRHFGRTRFNRLCHGGGHVFQGSAGSELTKAWGLDDLDSNVARNVTIVFSNHN